MTKRIFCAIILNMTKRIAGVAELADARDLKSRELIPRAGSIPVSGTKVFSPEQISVSYNFISRGRAARLARRAHNPEVRRFKSPPRNQRNSVHRFGVPSFFFILCVGFEPTDRRRRSGASSLTAAGGGKRESEKGENKEYRAAMPASHTRRLYFRQGNEKSPPPLQPLGFVL